MQTTTGPSFPHLFSPITIGGVTIRNRILSSGHDTVMAEHGLVSDRLIAYQEARARGAPTSRSCRRCACSGPTRTPCSSRMLTEDAVVIEGTSALVLAQGHMPADELLVELEADAATDGGCVVLAAGDVQSPRTIEEAVLEGLRAGVAI